MTTVPAGCLSVVIPCFNEEATVATVIDTVLAQPCVGEVIVVDDGSTDKSREILAAMDEPRLRVILQPRNQGKGAALRTGFAQATREYVVVQDADLEYDPEDIPRLINPVLRGKARVVYGSRFTGERRNMLFLHWVGNRFLSLLTNILYNSTLSDMETCYKLFDRELLMTLDLESDAFEIEAEVTAKLLKRRVRIYEVPISYAGREFDEGKKITWRDGFTALWTLLKYRVRD